MPDPNTERYSIEIKNLTTGETVILTAVEMTTSVSLPPVDADCGNCR